MKKYLMCALILCAIPALAAAEVNVTCSDCTHKVSVYMGEGGLIATADDADMVTWVATCGGVTTSGALEPDDDGKVTALFTMANGLACDSDKGSFELGPVTDGGWFWITDMMNSAVGNLVSKDILDNDPTMITSAGDGVTMMEGSGAVFLKETATGRVGILPNILPEPPMDPPTPCGQYWRSAGGGSVRQIGGSDAGNPTAQGESCMLDADYYVVLETPANAGGPGGRITSGMVYRNFSGPLTIVASLWGKGFIITNTTETALGRGFYSYNNDGTRRGTPLAVDTSGGTATSGWTVELSGTGPNANAVGGAGITVIPGDGSNGAEENEVLLSIGARGGDSSGGYCTSTVNHVATVSIKANPGTNNVVPGVPTDLRRFNLPDLRPSTTLRVMCPRSSANQGQDLVPENPFPPTTE